MLNKNYYLYHSTSKYDRASGRSKKVSHYIGRLTPTGVIEKKRELYAAWEYGNSELIYGVSSDLLDALRKSFFDRWRELYALSVTRLLGWSPMQYARDRWEKLHLARVVDAHLSPNILGDVLREVGRDPRSQVQFFRSLPSGGNQVAVGLSSTRSDIAGIAEEWHSVEHSPRVPPMNFVLVHSLETGLPLFMKQIPDPVIDFKSMMPALEEARFSGTVVLGRGAWSCQPTEALSSRTNFLLPLSRSVQGVDYARKLDVHFTYRDRGVRATSYQEGKCRVYLFEDLKDHAEEATALIRQIREGRRSADAYRESEPAFGKIAVITNLRSDPEQLYHLYKQREDLLEAFDSMRRWPEVDRTILRDEEAVAGYFFISFLSLYLYYRVLALIRRADLLGKLSVNELLLRLSKVYEIQASGRSMLSNVPDEVERLDESLGTGLFRRDPWSAVTPIRKARETS